jgi:hypothetical protein
VLALIGHCQKWQKSALRKSEKSVASGQGEIQFMSALQQLILFDVAPLESAANVKCWLYPLCTVFNVGDSGFYRIAASSKEEARAIAADQLRFKESLISLASPPSFL